MQKRAGQKSMIRAIVLDYAGVMTVPLRMPRKPESPHVVAESDPADVGAVLRSFMAHEIHNPDPQGMWNRLERGELSLEAFCTHLEDRNRAAGEAFRAMAGTMIAGLPLRSMMADRVRAWQANGLKTALLTNNVAEWRPLWRGKLEEADVLHVFDAVIDSSEVGMRKPESRIYHHVMERLGVAPHEAVFVDDFPNNVDGAIDVGLRAILALPDDSHLDEVDRLVQGIDSGPAQ